MARGQGGGSGQAWAAVFLTLAAVGCKDQGKESAARAAAHVSALAALAEKDVGEVERGLPQGARQMAALWKAGDPRQDAPAVRAALKKVRREVPDLNVAKSTFFALADEKAVGVRNDLEQDLMAGQDLARAFPALGRVGRGDGGVLVTTTGEFPGTKNDRDWVAASPVKKDDGTLVGMLVTGWSYRYFARHLQEQLMKDVKEGVRMHNEGPSDKMPILYVAVFDSSGVYTAPLTPAVNEKALAEADLTGKTTGGPWQGVLNLTGRDFGAAAARTPTMAPDTGIVVLRSEI